MIDILYSGYSFTHSRGIRFDTDRGHAGFDCWLLVFARNKATFLINDEFRECPAGTIVLFAQNTRKCYYSELGVPYTNDWIHFRTDERFMRDFPLLNSPIQPSDPDYIHNLFKLISWEAKCGPDSSEQIIRALFVALTTKLSEDIKMPEVSTHHRDLLNLRKEIILHPEYDWTVAKMADKLKVSYAHLQYLYKNTFGISCANDVIRLRIKLATDKLIYSADSIGSIAEQCGYRNEEHFCRQFKKITGTTPHKYRVKETKNTKNGEQQNEQTGI